MKTSVAVLAVLLILSWVVIGVCFMNGRGLERQMEQLKYNAGAVTDTVELFRRRDSDRLVQIASLLQQRDSVADVASVQARETRRLRRRAGAAEDRLREREMDAGTRALIDTTIAMKDSTIAACEDENVTCEEQLAIDIAIIDSLTVSGVDCRTVLRDCERLAEEVKAFKPKPYLPLGEFGIKTMLPAVGGFALGYLAKGGGSCQTVVLSPVTVRF